MLSVIFSQIGFPFDPRVEKWKYVSRRVALKRNSSRLSKTTLMRTRFRYIGDNEGANDVMCSVVRSLIFYGANVCLMKFDEV